MLKILNFTRTLLGTITDYQDLEIIHSLQDGDEQISFKYLGTTQIKNEYYVQTDRARYTIKSAEPEDDGTVYHGLLDLEDLQRNVFKQFTSTGQTLAVTAGAALENTLWSVSVDPSITGTRNVQRFKKTPLEIVYAIRDAWMCEVRFDNINRIVYFSEQFGEDKGVYLMRGLNLRKVSPTLDTYDYVTRIIPYGADGLTIEEVNDGVPFVENYQYTTKILTLIWEDTSYTDASALKADAIKKLDDLSKPKNSYSCDVIALSKMSGTYSILDYQLGDTVYLHDPVVGVNEKQRIVKYNEHPENPEMDSVEISNVVLSFEELQSRMNAAAQAWEEVMNGDGTVNGVYVHGVQADDVVGIETVITENATVQAGVTNVSVQYAQSNSPVIPPVDGWSDQAPEWDEGKYMWQRTVTTHASGEVDDPVVTCISGATGQPGTGGVGVNYQITYYAVSESNTVPPVAGEYAATEDGGIILDEAGFYVEMETVWSVIPPDRPEGWYTWMYVHTVYTDGTTDDSNPVCISGDHGDNGNGIKSVTEYYAVSDSSTQAPNDSRFTVEIQTMTEELPYLWNYEVIEYTLGDTKKSEKRVIGVYGFDGVGIDHITNYYLATSASSGVTKETAGWTDTVQNVTAEKKYLWNYEVITFTDGSTSEDDPCIIGAYGDTGDGIASITDYYAVSPSDTEYPPIYSNAGTEGGDNILTEGGDYVLTETSWTTWTTTRPVKPENWFLWMFTRTVYTDGTVYDTPPICISGADGTILTDTHEQYYLSTSNTTQTGGAWYDAAPDYIMGRYYWTRTITTFSNGIIRYSTPVLNLALTTANSTASTALESASGKNANFYQSGAPSSTGRQVGDLWFVMGTGDTAGKIIGMKEWTGSAWTDTPLTSAVFAFIDAGKITTGILSAILIKSDDNNYWNLSNSTIDGKPAKTLKTNSGDFTGDVNATSIKIKDALKLYSATWSAYRTALAIMTDDVYPDYPRIVIGDDRFGSIDFDFQFAVHMGALTVTHNDVSANGESILLSKTSFTVTLDKGTAHSSTYVYGYKYGKVVMIFIWWDSLSISAETACAHFYEGYAPAQAFYTHPTNGSATYAYVNSEGKIYVGPSNSGGCQVAFTYIHK